MIHDQNIVNGETRLVGELGLLPWLAADIVLPVRVFHTTIRYLDPSGQQVEIDNPDLHHRNETLTGSGDPWLLARAATRVAGFTLGARGGLTIPIGRTVPDPFELGDMGIPHEHSQFGTGTFEPVVGFDAARMIGTTRVDAFALTIQSLYANGYGYEAGDRYAGGIGAGSNLGTKRWRFRATVDAQHETAERWHGVVQSEEGNIGRTDVLAGAEVTWRVNDDWHLAASLQLPVYTHVEGGQLDQSAFVGISVGSSWHLFGDDDEHHHAKVTPGNWTGLDLADVSTDGSVVPLVPVPGKITVFDFWATWCEPCRVVDHELAEVVRRHPDDIAVRKYDVEDADSPASQRYVGDATLPHVKVFGRDGKLLWERSAAPRTLTADVEKLVTGATARPIDPNARRIDIAVKDDGFQPKHVEIGRGESVTLVFTRTSTTTCATDVHFVLPDQSRIDEELPLGVAVSIPLRVDQPGAITYSCGMDMEHGVVDVR